MNVVVVESPAKAKTVGRYGMRVPGRRRIWSSATSPPTHPIDCGSQTGGGFEQINGLTVKINACLSALRIHPLGVDCVPKMASESILHVVCVCINRIGTDQ